MFTIRILLCSLLFSSFHIYPQDSPAAVFNTPENILRFADFLYCSRDYFRASLEYEKYLQISGKNFEDSGTDTLMLKAALGYSSTDNFAEAKNLLLKLKQNKNNLAWIAGMEYYKIYLLEEDYDSFIGELSTDSDLLQVNNSLKLLYSGILLKDTLPGQKNFYSTFSDDDAMLKIFNKKSDPDKRSPLFAGILSAVIPGAGKIYTGRYIDGIFGFISTGIFAFLAYDNFKAGHKFRGALFTGLASLFYAGNIYGSVLSAHQFNLNFKASLDKELKLLIENRNYFIPAYDFCK